MKKEQEAHQRKQENFHMTKRIKRVLKGLENNRTQLRSDLTSEEIDRFYKPRRRGTPDPLELPVELSKAMLMPK